MLDWLIVEWAWILGMVWSSVHSIFTIDWIVENPFSIVRGCVRVNVETEIDRDIKENK